MCRKKSSRFRTILKEKTYIVTDGKICVEATISPSHLMMIKSEMADSFLFKNKDSNKTLNKWKNVLECIQHAVMVLEEERKVR